MRGQDERSNVGLVLLEFASRGGAVFCSITEVREEEVQVRCRQRRDV